MNNFPAMTEEQRNDLVKWLIGQRDACDELHGDGCNDERCVTRKIALAALTADTSKLAELAAKVRKVREDAADFDGDRRGMWEYQEEQEQLLLEEAVKYTAPPAPMLKLPEYVSNTDAEYDTGISHNVGWNACIDAVKRLSGCVK